MCIAASCEAIVVLPAHRVRCLAHRGKIRLRLLRQPDHRGGAGLRGASVLYSEDLHHGQIVDGKLSIRSPFRLRAEQRAKPYRTTKRRARIEPSPDPAGSLRHYARGKRKIPFKQARETGVGGAYPRQVQASLTLTSSSPWG